jgi:hypothetical protein
MARATARPDGVHCKDVRKILSYSNRQAVREKLGRDATTDELVEFYILSKEKIQQLPTQEQMRLEEENICFIND